MNAVSIAGWCLIGLVAGGSARLLVRRFSFLPSATSRLAMPGPFEVTTAVLFAALAWHFGAKPELFAYSWLAVVGVPLAAIDWTTRRLPTKLIWMSGVVLALLFSAAAAVKHDANPLIRAAVGMLVLLAFYGAIYFFWPDQLGGGDLRLGGLLGLALGWTSWQAILTGTLFGWLAAAVMLVAVRTTGRPEYGRELPLGPCLILGVFAALLLGITS